MSQYDRVEVMDFLINVLKDHEKSLDALISRAENVISEKEGETRSSGPPDFPQVKVVLKDWLEFRRRLKDAEIICFDLVESVFIVSASSGQRIYEYREAVPSSAAANVDMGGGAATYMLSIGLELRSTCSDAVGGRGHVFELDPQYTREWLSSHLGVHKDYIVCGDIEL